MSNQLFVHLGQATLWSTLGLIFFAIAFFLIKAICPFSIRKEIEEDQNVSLGIVIGSVMLGIAIIIAASIHG